MEENILLQIGCDGGDITVSSYFINGTFFYKLNLVETFDTSTTNTFNFITLVDAWIHLTHIYPYWYQLYLVSIGTQMTDLVKNDYLSANDKNEYTINSWLEQLTGRGIGF